MIKVIGASHCAACKAVSSLLDDKNIEHEYLSLDTMSDEEMEQIVKQSGSTSIPQIFFDDGSIQVGFKRDELEQKLSI